MTASYEYWSNALAGNFGPVHDSDPQPGFYRKRAFKAGAFLPAAIFEHDGSIVALVDGKAADASEIWTYVCQHPIAEQSYRDKMDGRPWPDEDASVTASIALAPPGHNNPPTDEAEVMRGQIEAAAKGVDDYAQIADDGAAAKAQSLRSRLLELSGDADKKREAEKKPHLEAGRDVDAKWQPLVKSAKAAADKIRSALNAHETRKANEAAAVARKAEEVRRAELAEMLAKNPQAPVVMPQPTPAPAPAPTTAIRGAYGRAATVKAVKVATVKDQDAAYAFLKAHKEMVELIALLAQRAVNAGYDVPGVEVTEERKVA